MNETEMLEDHEDDSNLVRDLRKQLRTATAERKAALEEASKYKTENRQSSIAKILADKNIPTKVVKLIPEGIVDEAGVNEWLGEYGDVFGVKAEPAEVVPPDGVDPAALAAFALAQSASHEGSPALAPGVEGKLKELRELSETAKTFEDVMAGLNKMGRA